MQALYEVELVITSFPEPKSKQVQCEFARRIVIAAKSFLSYVVNAYKSANLCKLMFDYEDCICDVDTML